MMRFRRSTEPKTSPAPGHDESWDDSALWGASVAIFLVMVMILGVGYLGYASIERPHHAVAAPSIHAARHR